LGSTKNILRIALAVLLGVLVWTPAPARAHGGDDKGLPIVETVTPTVDGLSVKVIYSANFQFLVSNPTDRDLAILADSGEPFLRIGPEGVFGNYRSPTWHNSNAPDGLQKFPREARSGRDVEPDWKLIRRQPSFGWFDHRLHPAERYVDPKVAKSKTPVKLGEWAVPIRYGDTDGEITGRFEFQPILGSYRSRLTTPEAPVEGLEIKLPPSNTSKGVPALFIGNKTGRPVVVLGDDEEPFVRLGPAAEVNVRSPVWAAIEQAGARLLAEPADVTAEPEWKQVGSTPNYGWPELRAAPPGTNPGRDVLDKKRPTTLKRWSIPILVGDDRMTISGITEFLPNELAIAAFEEAAAKAGQDGTETVRGAVDDEEKDDKKDSEWPVTLIVVLAIITVVLAMLLAWVNRHQAELDARREAKRRPPAPPRKMGRIKRR
jgi:hypothetical protein